MASRRIGTLLINPSNSSLTRFLTSSDIGVGSGLNADLLDGQHGSYYSPISSPALTGTPTAPTASAGTNTTQLATTAFVVNALSSLVDSAPATLDTLNELAAALGDDANFSTTVTNSIATKLSLSGGTISGKLTFSQVGSNQFIEFPSSTTLSTVTANDKVIVFRNLNQLRFESGNNWNYNNWAGISFDSGNNIMYIGGPAASQFTSNAGPANIDVDFVGLNASGLKKDGNVVWHAGNDGASSGLDADLLDGQQGSYYLDTSSTVQTKAGDLRIGGSGYNIAIGINNNVASSSVGRTATYNEGIFWHSDNTAYAIYRTAGGWASPDYQQLELNWPTGIRLNGGTSYGQSGVKVIGNNNSLTVNGNVAWNAGNDGSGSGLDADLLDGQQGSYYLDYNNLTNVPAAGSTPNNGTLTLNVSGTGLSGSASFTANQSGNSTFTVTSNATNANTASTIVARDGSGNFSAGTITAALSGNSTTATTLQTARTISLAGDVTGSVSFNGSANVSITATVADNSHNHQIANVSDSYKLFQNTSNHGTYTSFASTGSAMPQFGWNFVQGSTNGPGVNSASQYYRLYTGLGANYANTTYGMEWAVGRNVASPYLNIRYLENGTLGGWQKVSAGYADSAGKLQTARSITLTGDVTGTATFDGSANISITTTGGGGGGATNAVTTDYNSSLNSDSRNSRGVTRLYRRDNDSDYSVQTYWTGTYWRLYGYNGDNNHADTYCGVANQLATARTISLTGDVSGSASFNGSANVSITATVADNSHNHTNYIANTVDAWITSSDSRQRIYFANNSHSYWKSSLFHYWRVGNTDVNALTLDSSYNLTALGNITAYSDISLKENIESIENPLMIIRRMRGVRYDRNDIEGSKKHVGVIAQEVEEVLPEVVNIDETGLRTVAYGNITSVLIEGIKELEKIIIAQKDLILDMSNRISKLEEDNNGK